LLLSADVPDAVALSPEGVEEAELLESAGFNGLAGSLAAAV
jgi:hypothetical protein